jgi:hypothetical protein
MRKRKPELRTERDLYSRLIELCNRIVAATAAAEVEWQDFNDDRFVLARNAGSVAISSRDKDGEPPYDLSIYNTNGELVESLLSEWLDDDQPARWNQPLADVYRAGRRSALGADRVIDALIQELPPVEDFEDAAVAADENVSRAVPTT